MKQGKLTAGKIIKSPQSNSSLNFLENTPIKTGKSANFKLLRFLMFNLTVERLALKAIFITRKIIFKIIKLKMLWIFLKTLIDL